MTQQHKPGTTETTYRYVHLLPEELAHLPPEELLHACLELRQLLTTVKGVLYSPDATLILRAVTIDLLWTEAERLAKQQGTGADATITQDIKTVSSRLGIRPALVRQAYEELHSQGGVQIVARQFPRGKRQQPLPFEESSVRTGDD
jgi:hypothetical protein